MTIWVGTYSAKGGEGLYPLETRNGTLCLGKPETRIVDASFAVWSDRHRVAYFVEEQEQGRIAAWRHEGGWQPLGDLSSGGALPCYLSLSSDARWLACANYGDGVVTIIRLDEDSGALLETVATFQPSGRGVDPERQDGPHAHCVVFADDDRALYHVDLGLDRVFRHELDQGRIVATDIAFAAPPGAGPRHLALHSDTEALLICELSAQLLLLRRENGTFTSVDALATAPEPAGEDNLGGHLLAHPNGDVILTNRGHNSVVRLTARGGRLERHAWSFTAGSSPRHLLPQGGEVLVAHEEGGGVTRVVPGRSAEPIADIPGAVFLIEVP